MAGKRVPVLQIPAAIFEITDETYRESLHTKLQGVPPCVDYGGYNISRLHVLNIAEPSYRTLHDSEELQHMHNIYEAKQDFATRTDVLFYITSDDILKIKATPVETDKKIYLRLVVEAPRRQKSSPKIPHSSLHNFQRNSQRDSQCDSSQSPTKQRRSVSRHSSADTAINRSKDSSSKENLDNKPQMLTKKVVLYDKPFNIAYFKGDEKYSIFKIDALCDVSNSLICHGKQDSQVLTSELRDCKDVNIVYESKDITLYLRSLTLFVVPTYIVISTLDCELTIEQFVEIIEDLIMLVSKK